MKYFSWALKAAAEHTEWVRRRPFLKQDTRASVIEGAGQREAEIISSVLRGVGFF